MPSQEVYHAQGCQVLDYMPTPKLVCSRMVCFTMACFRPSHQGGMHQDGKKQCSMHQDGVRPGDVDQGCRQRMACSRTVGIRMVFRRMLRSRMACRMANPWRCIPCCIAATWVKSVDQWVHGHTWGTDFSGCHAQLSSLVNSEHFENAQVGQAGGELSCVRVPC